MYWENGDGKLCEMIRDRRTASQAQGNDYESFQVLVASLRAFEAVGLVENVKELPENHTGHRFAAAASWKTPSTVLAGSVSASQRRWLLLRFLGAKCEEAQSQFFGASPQDFAGLAGNAERIEQAGQWLGSRDFVQWLPSYGGGLGRILDKGHEALEHGLLMLTESKGLTVQNIDQRNQSINVGTLNAGSGDLIIGPEALSNKPLPTEESGERIRVAEDVPGAEAEKKTTKSRVSSALRHPLLITIVGAALTAIFAAIVAQLSR